MLIKFIFTRTNDKLLQSASIKPYERTKHTEQRKIINKNHVSKQANVDSQIFQKESTIMHLLLYSSIYSRKIRYFLGFLCTKVTFHNHSFSPAFPGVFIVVEVLISRSVTSFEHVFQRNKVKQTWI